MWEQIKRRSSYQALPLIESKKPTELYKDLHHPIFQNIRIAQVDNGRGNLVNQTIITLNKVITTQALHQCLKFIYTGSIEKELSNVQVKRVTFKREMVLYTTIILNLF